MALFNSDPSRLQDHETEYEAVNGSATFLLLAAIVAIVIALPLAFFF